MNKNINYDDLSIIKVGRNSRQKIKNIILKLKKKLQQPKINKGFSNLKVKLRVDLVSKYILIVKIRKISNDSVLRIYKVLVDSKGHIQKFALVLHKKLKKQTINAFLASSILFGGFHPTKVAEKLSGPSQFQTSITRNWDEDNPSKHLEAVSKKKLSEKNDKTSQFSRKNNAALIKKIIKLDSAFGSQEKIDNQMPTLTDFHQETKLSSIGLKELLKLVSAPQVLVSNKLPDLSLTEKMQLSSFTIKDILQLKASEEFEISHPQEILDLQNILKVQRLQPLPKMEVPTAKAKTFRNRKKDIFISNLFSRKKIGTQQRQLESSFLSLKKEKHTSHFSSKESLIFVENEGKYFFKKKPAISFPIAGFSPTFQVIHTVRGGNRLFFQIEQTGFDKILNVLKNKSSYVYQPLKKEEIKELEAQATYYNSLSLKELYAKYQNFEMSTTTYRELSNIIIQKNTVKLVRRFVVGLTLSTVLCVLVTIWSRIVYPKYLDPVGERHDFYLRLDAYKRVKEAEQNLASTKSKWGPLAEAYENQQKTKEWYREYLEKQKRTKDSYDDDEKTFFTRYWDAFLSLFF